jgi:hypothetical protein
MSRLIVETAAASYEQKVLQRQAKKLSRLYLPYLPCLPYLLCLPQASTNTFVPQGLSMVSRQAPLLR